MTLKTFGNKRDANEQAIFATLKDLGAQVYPLDKPCDAPVNFRGQIALIEVKGRKGKLTPSQALFAATWPMQVIRSRDEAIEFIQKLAKGNPDEQFKAPAKI